MDISSANSRIVYTDNMFCRAGVMLAKFSTDQSLSQDEVTYAETRMGVDGKMAAGFVPAIIPVTIVFEADSPSWKIMGKSFNASKALKRPLICSLEVSIPSVGYFYSYKNGVLKSITDVGLKKVLDPITVKFDFETRSDG